MAVFPSCVFQGLKNVCKVSRNVIATTLLTTLTSTPFFNTAVTSSTRPCLQRIWSKESPCAQNHRNKNTAKFRWYRANRLWMQDSQLCRWNISERIHHDSVEPLKIAGHSQVIQLGTVYSTAKARYVPNKSYLIHTFSTNAAAAFAFIYSENKNVCAQY